MGPLPHVALAAKIALDQAAGQRTPAPVLVFDDATGEVIELDWRGTVAEFKARFELLHPALGPTETAGHLPMSDSLKTGNATLCGSARGPGRPRLGVVAREVTLLPRHWDWLFAQPGGASVALRKLVEGAKRASETLDRVRDARAASYKFMSTIAGHEPGFEEAGRALFAGDPARFEERIAEWPVDVQCHLKKLLMDAFIEGTVPDSSTNRLALD